MLANQASSTPPTTAASSDQVMQDGAGRLWTSLGQAPALQMAWRRLPAFRRDMERRVTHRNASKVGLSQVTGTFCPCTHLFGRITGNSEVIRSRSRLRGDRR